MLFIMAKYQILWLGSLNLPIVSPVSLDSMCLILAKAQLTLSNKFRIMYRSGQADLTRTEKSKDFSNGNLVQIDQQ